jgi:hypothetical protein
VRTIKNRKKAKIANCSEEIDDAVDTEQAFQEAGVEERYTNDDINEELSVKYRSNWQHLH